MPAFKFEAMDTTGSEVKDSIDAINEEEAQQKIKQMGYFVTKLTAVGTAKGGKGAKGNGWFSFNQRGVHFIGLVNVMNIAEGGLGILGEDQLAWLKDDVSGRSSSTPIVVFAHVPLWSLAPHDALGG